MYDSTANRIRASLTATLAFVLFLTGTFSADPLSAQDPPPTSAVCYACGPGCNGGRMCIPAGGGRYGGKVCKNAGGPEFLEDVCHCWPSGGICLGAGEKPKLARAEALSAVERGRMLPTNGQFYVATRGGHVIVRRKCDGEAIGRVLVAGSGRRSAVRTVG